MTSRANSQHAASVTDEQVKLFAEHRFTWLYDGQHFRFEVENESTRYVGFTLSGKWAASYRDYRMAEDTEDWQGPSFDDPVTALVHAEIENWGQV